MRAIIHKHQEGKQQIIIYQNYMPPELNGAWDQFPALKEWEGTLQMKNQEIMLNDSFQISTYFPGYIGTAVATRIKDEVVSFRGIGILRKVYTNHTRCS